MTTPAVNVTPVICRHWFQCCLLMAVFLFSPSLLATERLLTPDDNSFDEKYNPNVDVSGQVQAGFMLSNIIDRSQRKSLQDKVSLESLQAHFLGTGASKDEVICYRLTSRDGIYSAKWTVTLDADIPVGTINSDVFRVRFRSLNEDKIQNYGTRELVAIATVGTGCKDRNRRYIASSWGEPDTTKEQLTYALFLNHDATQSTLHARANNPGNSPLSVKEECIRIPGSEKTVAFNTECRMTIPLDHTLQKMAVSGVNHTTVLPVLRFPLKRQ